jgi:hypothetical protein
MTRAKLRFAVGLRPSRFSAATTPATRSASGPIDASRAPAPVGAPIWAIRFPVRFIVSANSIIDGPSRFTLQA